MRIPNPVPRRLLVAVLVLTLVVAGCTSPPAPSDGGDGGDGDVREAEPPRLRFTDVTAEAGVEGCGSSEPASELGHGAGWGDYDDDGDPDLFVACPGPDRLYRNDGNGSFTEVAEDAGVAGGDAPSTGVAWGDADGDGCLDLYVTSVDPQVPNRLHRNLCDGTFSTQGNASGTVDAGDASTSAAWMDQDLDGDADLLVANRGPNRLYVNDGNGSFRDVAAEAGVAGDADTRSVVWFDHDSDGFPDLLTVRAEGGVELLQNLGGGEFRSITASAGMDAPGEGRGVTAGDVDADGDVDLVVTDATGDRLWFNGYEDVDTRGTFAEDAAAAGLENAGGWGASLGDLDSDGDLDLLVVNDDGSRADLLLQSQGNGTFQDVTGSAGVGEGGARAVALADHDLDGDLDAYVTGWDGSHALLRNDGPQEAWLKLVLQGNVSNAQGLGAVVEVQDGDGTWIREVRGGGGGFLGTDSSVVHVGVGDREAVQAVRIFWPSGAHQALLNVTTNETIVIEESNTEKTSCPLLFGWTGESFEFKADVLGNSYMGWRLAPGEGRDVFMQPDPTERVRFDELEPRNGVYELRFGEVLEETDFLDYVALTAVDHPPGVDVVPREAFRVESVHEGYGLVPLVDPEPVASAVTSDGRDVTELVQARDGESPDVPRIENPRMDGYAETHSLTVDLGDVAGAERVQLAAYGWIYYQMTIPILAVEGPYTPPQPPVLEARDPATGEWVTVVEEMGFPAGTPKWMTLNLTGDLPEGAHEVRITTNMQIHWDQILVDTASAEDVELETHTVPPSEATLRDRGYPVYVDDGPQEPGSYLYDEFAPAHVWDVPEGNVTRYGDVTELLTEVDDRFVVFPHGDEVIVRFDADALPPVREGWERTLFVDMDAFFKDMVRYNAHTETVGPYPFHGMSNYPYGPEEAYPSTPEHEAYMETYQTRRIG